ncbi:MAG: group II intron reverse transcriptase/maturase, partial [Candidatus Cloacimonetes bacterium]|nr:group II intron reverse transcriptase/maturase [Candidatus Cloacimonadota bacterium]MDD2230594.1 group II intron reverse transcriptase/maturase [Candidatus Cloacimonadota bacterium]
RNSFPDQDGWIRRRLRSILKKRDKRRGIATNIENRRYPNHIFDSCGFFSFVKAHRELCQSLK